MKYMFLLFNAEPDEPPDPAALAAMMPKWEGLRQSDRPVRSEDHR